MARRPEESREQWIRNYVVRVHDSDGRQVGYLGPRGKRVPTLFSARKFGEFKTASAAMGRANTKDNRSRALKGCHFEIVTAESEGIARKTIDKRVEVEAAVKAKELAGKVEAAMNILFCYHLYPEERGIVYVRHSMEELIYTVSVNRGDTDHEVLATENQHTAFERAWQVAQSDYEEDEILDVGDLLEAENAN